jgi:2,3,4,5-tetrahydropyridine-2-carboxylate N-succinyltransferase
LNKQIVTVDDFKSFVSEVESKNNYRKPIAFGIARIDKGQLNKSKTLQATYPLINWKENYGSFAVFFDALKEQFAELDSDVTEATFDVSKDFLEKSLNSFAPFVAESYGDKHKNIQIILQLNQMAEKEQMMLNNFKFTVIFADEALKSVEATYLKLYALSQRKAELRSINLNGAFGVLSNVAWSGNTPYELEYLRKNEIKLKICGKYPEIDFVDKFPRLLQHVIPDDNTRILEASKVRFGAYISAGTTVMPGASYINFNAGTTGVSMVEGRISSSALVGDGSDVGGGASILGVLSGTNGNPITVGKNCLLGANCVCGVPLNDGSIIDAGISILEGTKVTVSAVEVAKLKEVNPDFDFDSCSKDDSNNIVEKASKLSALKGIHYRQNSKTGQIIAFRSVREIKLNEELH